MEIRSEDYILGIWFAEKNKGIEKGNVLGMAIRRPDGKWYVEIRTRMYRDEKTFASDDKKRFNSFELKKDTPEEFVKEKLDEIFDMTKNFFPNYYEYVEIKGNLEAMLLKTAELKWFNVMHLPKGGSNDN